ncbi:MAG: sulfotransferase domain-containing protein [Roseivirga sp.]|nr:sulfotransferase domain-containing protein [Roseivirga sp.]
MITKIQRSLNTLRKRNTKLRHKVPYSLRQILLNSSYTRNKLRNTFIANKYRSEDINVYHCCIQKTGSVWISSILNDPLVYQYSGLTLYNYQGAIRQKQTDPLIHLKEPFPKKSIVSAMKISHENYTNDILKNPGSSKVFFVMRDPRELVISWYFSTKKNHILGNHSNMGVHRDKLNELDQKEGIKYAIDQFYNKDKFGLLESWMNHKDDKNILILRYENLISDSVNEFSRLFKFLDIRISDEKLKQLIYDYSFEKITGREIGVANENSHLRGGGKDSWRQYFDEEILAYFYEKSNDVAKKMGYE